MCQYNNGKLVKAVSIFDVCFCVNICRECKSKLLIAVRVGRSVLGPVAVVAVVREGARDESNCSFVILSIYSFLCTLYYYTSLNHFLR